MNRAFFILLLIILQASAVEGQSDFFKGK